MTTTLTQKIPQIKQEVTDLKTELNALYGFLCEKNRITYVGTVHASFLGDLPDRISILDRKMRVIFNSFEIPNAWHKFSEILSSHQNLYQGKDALDNDIEYAGAAKKWNSENEIFLDFLIDAELDQIKLEAVTSENIQKLENKYTQHQDPTNESKFELLMKLKTIFNDLSKKSTATASVKTIAIEPITSDVFVNAGRISELKSIQMLDYDLCKLIRLCEEINMAYGNGAYLSVAMLVRSVIDHVPPIFGFHTFADVANQYGGKSLKKSLQNLQNSLRNISDSFLHQPIRSRESLPNSTQVDFRNDLDVLLGEIFRLLK